MITVAMSTVIHAERERVWSALTDPSERLRWDEALLARVSPEAAACVSAPQVGETGRWRFRLGSVPTIMKERVLAIHAPERFQARVSIGGWRYERTFTLSVEPGDMPKTRLGMKLVASSALPTVDGVVDRFEVRRLVSERIDSTLRAVQKHCENATPRA